MSSGIHSSTSPGLISQIHSSVGSVIASGGLDTLMVKMLDLKWQPSCSLDITFPHPPCHWGHDQDVMNAESCVRLNVYIYVYMYSHRNVDIYIYIY